MDSPQKENGYTPIANELLEAFYRCKLLEYERVIMLCIWRKTYGWNKKEDWISNSQFHKETGIPKPHITRTLRALREKKIVTKDRNKVTINKTYWNWEVEWRKVTSPGNKVTSPGNKTLPHQVPTKERKTIYKNNKRKQVSQSKKKSMWNDKSDDYVEGEVDLDGDGTLSPNRKKSTRKYPNALTVFEIFKSELGKYPANWKLNKTQLQAAENLSTERGLPQIKKALVLYKERKDEKFCPQISSPYDLDSKWSKLYKFIKE